jgi:hypothetical protein
VSGPGKGLFAQAEPDGRPLVNRREPRIAIPRKILKRFRNLLLDNIQTI